MKKLSLVLILVLALAAGAIVVRPSPLAHAEGFGITPPYVTNDSLTQNSHYEQTIVLVRSDTSEDLQAKVTINVPGADDWITIDKGTQFTIPAGSQQVPMIVSVNVPANAKLGHYTGNIQVVVSPLAGPTPGTVGITIGAQINVDLQVIDQKNVNFIVHRVTMSNAEVGSSFLWMNFPGKVLFTMDLENTGNIAGSPDKVVFQYESYLTQNVLETETNTNHLASIAPFDSQQITAEMPVYLPQGTYRVYYQIYGRDDGNVIGQGTLDLSVLPPGTLAAYAGYGFWGIRWTEKFITFGVIAAILAALYGLFLFVRYWFRRWRRGKGSRVFMPPPPPPSHYR
jgi:methionine-rich copper-binding protein CopC